MQEIHLKLQDTQLEQTVLRLAKQQQQSLQEFVMSALNDYIQRQEQTGALTISKLDPLQHSKAPEESFQAPTELIFTDIKSSTKFAKTLRQQAWQRNE